MGSCSFVNEHIGCKCLNICEFKEVVVIIEAPLEVDDVNVFGCLEGYCYGFAVLNNLSVNAVAVVGNTAYAEGILRTLGCGL